MNNHRRPLRPGTKRAPACHRRRRSARRRRRARGSSRRTRARPRARRPRPLVRTGRRRRAADRTVRTRAGRKRPRSHPRRGLAGCFRRKGEAEYNGRNGRPEREGEQEWLSPAELIGHIPARGMTTITISTTTAWVRASIPVGPIQVVDDPRGQEADQQQEREDRRQGRERPRERRRAPEHEGRIRHGGTTTCVATRSM